MKFRKSASLILMRSGFPPTISLAIGSAIDIVFGLAVATCPNTSRFAGGWRSSKSCCLFQDSPEKRSGRDAEPKRRIVITQNYKEALT
jgi:hypothetical protein